MLMIKIEVDLLTDHCCLSSPFVLATGVMRSLFYCDMEVSSVVDDKSRLMQQAALLNKQLVSFYNELVTNANADIATVEIDKNIREILAVPLCRLAKLIVPGAFRGGGKGEVK